MDQWFEEDEEVFVHPRDPCHRVDVVSTRRNPRISLDGELLAATDRALALFESNLRARWYLAREDVRAGLEPSETITRCSHQGTASYQSVRLAGGELGRDLLWSYESPIAEAARIAGLVCFFNERVDIELDGEGRERPESPWSTGVNSDPAAQNAARRRKRAAKPRAGLAGLAARRSSPAAPLLGPASRSVVSR